MGLPTTSLTDRAAPPPGVAVELGEDNPVEGQSLVEGPGCGHRVLACHRVDHQECEMRIDRIRYPSDLLHHLGIHSQPAGCVDDDHIAPAAAGLCDGLRRHGHRVGRLAEDRGFYLAGESAQLLDRGGTLQVGTD